ncbi:RNA polymerase sigma factor [Marinirhabdus gelatinilytica]|uniref:RNA polymerase sigma-70 factor (ECF subfamily) n=1 Tax=Marinirhabdus gelatinilytica TaxID=1703343 RepID=A0A370QLG4_9FLAO|nr:RNA polymerase sigma factor [Marinirhabdus gelatinilytica]RDK89189.1 RNA polymerase sigma-70 factor (ECF subfamily) [Marinirhabdus gelatinilytica]
MEAININDYNNQKISEEQVISRVLGGEKELFEILIKRNNQKLYRIIRGYLKDEAEIEDVMQNTYLKAFSKLHQFKLQSSFSTWLIRIGINNSLARIKAKGKLLHLLQQPDSLKSNTIFEIPDNRQLNPQDKMIQNESKRLLENAIDSLDVKYKTVYIMKEIEEMSLKEVATALDLTVANVKIRLHRSKDKLKDKLYEVTNTKDIFEFGFSRCDRITENVMKNI